MCLGLKSPKSRLNIKITLHVLYKMCIIFYFTKNRESEAGKLIRRMRTRFETDGRFLNAWAKHAINGKDEIELMDLVKSPAIDILREESPIVCMRLLREAGLMKEAIAIADIILRAVPSLDDEILMEVVAFFDEIVI